MKEGPQGSVLEPILFDIFLNDLFFFLKKWTYAAIPVTKIHYSRDQNLDQLIGRLKHCSLPSIIWSGGDI